MQFLHWISTIIFSYEFTHLRKRRLFRLINQNKDWQPDERMAAKLLMLRYHKVIKPSIRRFPFKREWHKFSTPLWSTEELQLISLELQILYSLTKPELALLRNFMRFQNSIWESTWSRHERVYVLRMIRTHFLSLAFRESTSCFYWNVKGELVFTRFNSFQFEPSYYGFSLTPLRVHEQLCIINPNYESAILTILWKNRNLHTYPNIQFSPILGPTKFLGCPCRIRGKERADLVRLEVCYHILRLLRRPWVLLQRLFYKWNPLHLKVVIFWRYQSLFGRF